MSTNYRPSDRRIAELAAPHLVKDQAKPRYVESGKITLTPKQAAVRDLAFMNLPNKEMARILGQSPRSIAATMTIVLREYKCRSRKELILVNQREI